MPEPTISTLLANAYDNPTIEATGPQSNPGELINWPMLKNTYRTDKDRIAALLPPGIEPGDDPHVNVTIYNTPGTRNGVSVPPSEAWLSYCLVSVERKTPHILPVRMQRLSRVAFVDCKPAGRRRPGLCGSAPEARRRGDPRRVIECSSLDEQEPRSHRHAAEEGRSAIAAEAALDTSAAGSGHAIEARRPRGRSKVRLGHEAERRERAPRRALAVGAVTVMRGDDCTPVDLKMDCAAEAVPSGDFGLAHCSYLPV